MPTTLSIWTADNLLKISALNSRLVSAADHGKVVIADRGCRISKFGKLPEQRSEVPFRTCISSKVPYRGLGINITPGGVWALRRVKQWESWQWGRNLTWSCYPSPGRRSTLSLLDKWTISGLQNNDGVWQWSSLNQGLNTGCSPLTELNNCNTNDDI